MEFCHSYLFVTFTVVMTVDQIFGHDDGPLCVMIARFALRCKTCLFIVNTSRISGPKRSVKITDRFTYTSANVIYCIGCSLLISVLPVPF